LVFNSHDRIADATIANVFIVKDGVIQTPSLDEGCVGGIIRKHLLRSCKAEGFKIEEAVITEESLREASELFLTNAISGIRWVRSLGNDHFKNEVSRHLYAKFVQPLFND
jgi:branched-subunit amino acid aminotransferase/4-amino-4-deoxychorismate lyase